MEVWWESSVRRLCSFWDVDEFLPTPCKEPSELGESASSPRYGARWVQTPGCWV